MDSILSKHGVSVIIIEALKPQVRAGISKKKNNSRLIQ